MDPTQYMAVGFVALLVLGGAAYLLWGMVTFAADAWKGQLETPKRGGSWSTAHVARQVTGASAWIVVILFLFFGVTWAVGVAVSGVFLWG